MNQDDRELVLRLCARAGMMLEDASATAVLVSTVPAGQLKPVVEHLVDQVPVISALLEAALAIAGGGSELPERH